MNLQEEKAKLVDAYTKVLEQIDRYGLRDIAISNKPLKELLNKRDYLILKIEELNKLLDVKD